MKFVSLLSLLPLFFAACNEVPPPTTPKQPVEVVENQLNVRWERLDDEVLQRVITDGKIMLVFVEADGCGPCHEMDKTVFTNACVVHAINDTGYFTAVKINLSKEMNKLEVELLSALFPDGKAIIPLLFLTFPTGDVVDSKVELKMLGTPMIGQLSEEDACKVMRQVVSVVRENLL